MDLGWDFPLGCSSFSLRGCPVSALAIAGIGCRVLLACPFFGTGTLFLPRLFSSPLTLPGIVYDVPGVLALGSGLVASA